MQEDKKTGQLSFSETMSYLNLNLQDEILICIIGQIIKKQKLLKFMCDERLQSEMIFMLEQKGYNLDDHIFEEGETEDKFVNDNILQDGMLFYNMKKKEKNRNKGIFFITKG